MLPVSRLTTIPALRGSPARLASLLAYSLAMRAAQSPASRPYHHGDLRRALLDAALAALARDPHATFTLRSLARDVGVSHNAPYTHFADKTALLAALADLGFADLAARLRAAADATHHAGGDAAATFVNVGAAYVRFGLEHPAHYRLMFSTPELADVGPDLATARGGTTAFGVLLAVLARLHGAPDAAPPDAANAAGASDVAGVEEPRAGEPSLPAAVARDALAAFALGHGLTSLLLDQRTAVAVGPVAPAAAETAHLARAVFALLLPGLRPAAAVGIALAADRVMTSGSSQ